MHVGHSPEVTTILSSNTQMHTLPMSPYHESEVKYHVAVADIVQLPTSTAFILTSKLDEMFALRFPFHVKDPSKRLIPLGKLTLTVTLDASSIDTISIVKLASLPSPCGSVNCETSKVMLIGERGTPTPSGDGEGCGVVAGSV